MEKNQGLEALTRDEEIRIPFAKWSRKQSCNLSEEGKAPETMQPPIRRSRKPIALSGHNPSLPPMPFGLLLRFCPLPSFLSNTQKWRCPFINRWLIPPHFIFCDPRHKFMISKFLLILGVLLALISRQIRKIQPD